jgi:peptidoglycan/xylan/chitin deacetylase (PgdA/CDA1 family)
MINLCFHGIGTPDRPLEPGEDRYWISPRLFDEVLGEVAGRFDVSISFDDGNASDLEIGLPGLLRHGRTATFFVLAGRLDQPGSLGVADLGELRRHGMTIGSHGMRHVPWRGLTAQEQHREWVDAREVIAAAAGAPVAEAALPLGRYDRTVLHRLRRLGYEHVWSSDRRPSQAGSWLQPRFSLVGSDTIESVRTEALSPAPWRRRARSEAVGLVKRWR